MSDLLARDQAAIWHPFTPLLGSPDVLPLKKAKGVWLETTDGRRIIDAISSWWVNLHGHSHPHIAQAIAKQAAELEHVIFAGFTHEPAVKLAENLLSILPGNMSDIFYSDNGSTAVEVAMKMAFQYWHNRGEERRKIIAIEGAYHGDTFGAMSVGDRGPFTKPFDAHLFEVAFIPFPEQGREDEVLTRFRELVRSGEVAAFVYEPLVQGAAGMKMYSAATLQALLTEAHAEGVLCIADEVFTGFGRTGSLFASTQLAGQPDLICLSKGLTGGALPMGVTACTAEVKAPFETSDILKTFFHGHSFTANPIICAAANASFELLMRPEGQEQVKQLTARQAAQVARFAAKPNAEQVRQLGTILALDIKTMQDTSYVNEARHQLYPFFIERGVLLRPLGNVIYVVPPYCINEQELEQVYTAIEEMLETFKPAVTHH